MLSVKDSGRKTAVFSAHPPVHVYQLHVHCKTSKNYKLSVQDSGRKTAVFSLPVSIVCDALLFNPEKSKKCRFIWVKTQLCITLQTKKNVGNHFG